MSKTLKLILSDFSKINFVEDETFVWSPADKLIKYDPGQINTEPGLWSLLHEIGHAELDHDNYQDDLELLMMEVAAWKKAKEIALNYEMKIDQEHIDICIDSYRDWLHTRSKCVECGTHSLQSDNVTYHCHNCGTSWNVPASRMCIPRKTRVKTK